MSFQMSSKSFTEIKMETPMLSKHALKNFNRKHNRKHVIDLVDALISANLFKKSDFDFTLDDIVFKKNLLVSIKTLGGCESIFNEYMSNEIDFS